MVPSLAPERAALHTVRMPAHSLRGVFSMLAAVVSFSIMDVLMKHLVATYPSMQVTYLRGIASLPILVAASAVLGNWRQLKPVRWELHLLRALVHVATLWLFVYSLRILSLADAYTIFMSAPLLITALSVILLREHVEPARWIAVMIGMAGVIIVMRPTGASLVTIGGLAAFAAALGYAVNAITIRILARTDSSAATVFWVLLLMTIISGVLAAPRWVELRSQDWIWIAALGVSGAFGQYFITEAFRRARPAVIAPLEYTALAWGMLFDWLIWTTLPSARMLIGASIIVAAGIYVIRKESVTQVSAVGETASKQA